MTALFIAAALATAQAKKQPATTTHSLPAPKHFDDADLAPGFVGEYFRDVKDIDDLEKAAKPFLVRTDNRIEFLKSYGEFHGTKLSNNFAARWNGILRITQPGTYRISVWADDKSRLYIGDQRVIDNTKEGDEDNDWFELEKGDYPIRMEFLQTGESAHVVFSRKFNGSDWEAFPAANLFHQKSQEEVAWDPAAWDAFTFDRAAWFRDFAPKFMKMDYGPFLSHTINVEKGNTVNKAIAIKLNVGDEKANVLFDTELLRYAAGWTGGFIDNKGVAFDGAHGENPTIEGNVVFTTRPQPEWSANGDFNDPRQNPLGPMPREFGHYKGLYRNGDKIILSYSIGGRDVLDMPSCVLVNGKPSLLRIIEVLPGEREISLYLGTDEARHLDKRLNIPASASSITFEAPMSDGDKIETTPLRNASPLSKLCKSGGPAHWPQVIETKGALGDGDAPYVVDTLTVPEDNPWDSWMRFGGLDFFADGRAALCTWSGDVWIVSGIDQSLEHLKWKRYASGMFQPLGLRIVNDQIYVLGRDQLTRLHDLNKDDEADFYENFNNDCIVSSSFHEFALDLQTDAEGNFYFAKGGPVRPGGRGWQQITDHNGCVLKISRDGSKFEVFATGVRAPNGMGAGPHGEISVSDNEGTWTPACRLSFVSKGDFLGVVDLAHQESVPSEYKPPICWFPHEDVDNSSGGQTWVRGDRWGPFENRMLHTSYGMCDLFLVMTSQVDGVTQGGFVKFPNLSFDTGIMRPRFRPQDGQLYVTGLKGWQTRGAKDGALQRVRFTGKPVRMPTALRVGRDEVSITFTTALDKETAIDPDSYNVEQWNYIWSKDYGSPEMSVEDATREGHDTVNVDSVSLSDDAKTVTLKIPGLKPVMQQKISLKIDTADGVEMEYDVYHTINRVPK